MKKILLFLSVALLAGACDRVREEVMTTYQDGSPELVYLVKGKDDAKQIVGERRYYSNGEKHSELHFLDQEGNLDCADFFYPDGNAFAKLSGGQWRFFANDGQNADLGRSGYDSIHTAQMSEKHLPVEVHAFRGDSTWVYRFYEDFLPQSSGLMISGLREGKWIFFHPNGRVQLEAMFHAGLEDGAYNMYRESGLPIVRGFYIEGQRAGTWEIYDAEGELSGRNNYDSSK